MKLKEEIKNGIFHKLYLFIGTDKALIKKRIGRIADALNLQLPKSVTIENEIQWKELLSSLNEQQLFSKTRLEVAILLFIPKKLNFNFADGNHLGLISEKPIKFTLADCYMEDTGKFGKSEYTKYIKYFITHHGKSAGREIIETIYENCGKDIAKIEQETLKLIAYIGARDSINSEDLIILTKKSSGGWINLHKRGLSFSHNDKFLKKIEKDGKPPQVASGTIFNALIKQSEHIKKKNFNQALELIKQADIAIKRSDSSLGFIILRQLLFKLNIIIDGGFSGQNFWKIMD
ncbi:MAG: hypothetical protein GXP60_05265 [Epsilonproteobacteria bacterium]|nr:hypothetical protein [Campylobacterota bacterium]